MFRDKATLTYREAGKQTLQTALQSDKTLLQSVGTALQNDKATLQNGSAALQIGQHPGRMAATRYSSKIQG
jgi:hypothetical protein